LYHGQYTIRVDRRAVIPGLSKRRGLFRGEREALLPENKPLSLRKPAITAKNPPQKAPVHKARGNLLTPLK